MIYVNSPTVNIVDYVRPLTMHFMGGRFSMADLDRGGFFRPTFLQNLGPTIGLVPTSTNRALLAITAGGAYTVDVAVTYVTVNTTGSVTITLPSTINPPAGAGAVPGPFTDTPIIVVDIGGNATLHPITIQAAGGDQITGLGNITISSNYGGYALVPNADTREWNFIT